MASLTIRNLDDSVKAGLRLRAAKHGQSMYRILGGLFMSLTFVGAEDHGHGRKSD